MKPLILAGNMMPGRERMNVTTAKFCEILANFESCDELDAHGSYLIIVTEIKKPEGEVGTRNL
jgi:hypothetical protein